MNRPISKLTPEQTAIYEDYIRFFKTGTGRDLIDRLKMIEATRMMEGMKASTIEGKGISMAKMEQIYAIRTMLEDLSKPARSQSDSSVGS